MKTPVNKSTLKQHFTYYWWLYLLVAVIAVLGVNLLYTVTAYRVPNDRKIRMIVYGLADQEGVDHYMESIRQSDLSDMEKMDSEQIPPDDLNGLSTLSTRVYASDGDIYVLPLDTFISYAESGVLMPLEDDKELMEILGDRADVTRGWRTLRDSEESHLFGIPLNQLPGLASYVYAERGFICVAYGSTNPDNTLKFFRILCRDMLTAPETDATETASPSPETP